MAKRTAIALSPKQVTPGPAWVIDSLMLRRYKTTLSYEEIKKVARTCVSASVFVCEGFRIRPQSDVNDFATLNQLKPGRRTLSQFEKLASQFRADFERLLCHIALNRPSKLDFETERRLLEKVLGRPLNFSLEDSSSPRGQSTKRGRLSKNSQKSK